MKKLQDKIDRLMDRLDERWRALPRRKQRRYTICLFAGYLLLTAGVIAKLRYDTGKPGNILQPEHIVSPINPINPILQKNEKPASLQDTSITILKDKTHESE
ncbi:nitrogen regulatory IIA protein [Parapedobacter sp. 10938]|uniref:nitrogen regulatory IIA protein n=1 Tax=Parapedobacter flavus TaxID=3110225 RepID=UPI002DB6FB50|nr:nitrogen regulatory IIA protein [Parapedobacter sp. 10938]MEC3880276.1 nitrogen regulatory IIA protein [Parapedobacter sp. 10938]